jgi:isoaspartyl peptidase/L-asparaginase-like protein (Ntn-hydrolase superfamily)
MFLSFTGVRGNFSKQEWTPERLAQHRAALRSSLQAGYDVLSAGGEAMDAVVAAVAVMEGQPLRSTPILMMSDQNGQFRLPAVQCRERLRIQC